MSQSNKRYNGFTEKDWKLFRNKIAGWQEAYMDRLNGEYLELLTQEGASSDKFWELEKRINRDKKKVGVSIYLRRSTMIMDIRSLLKDEVIDMNDLNEFSKILRDTIKGAG